MTRILATGLATACFVLLALSAAAADDPAGTHRFDFGFDHRARYVDFDNIIDYDNEADDENRFFRFRTRLWGRLQYGSLEFKLQMTNEFRHYNHPDRDDSFDEAFVDLCYVKLDDMFGSGWSMTAGRQNIIRGEGFLFFDASPLDGSRSIYYNALVFQRAFGNSRLEIMGISNPYKDKYFPVIGDKDKMLIEHDEEALAGIFTHTFPSKAVLEATYIYKRETSPFDAAESGYSPDRSMHIAGLRMAVPAGTSDLFTAEFAAAMGEEDIDGYDLPDRDIASWGGLAAWKHTFAGSMTPYVKFSVAGFSGDDPDTADDEGWSPPFARWPKYSELYIYSQIRERGIAQWSNLWFANAEFVITPAEPVKLRFSYYRLMAFYNWVFKNSGKTRGDLLEFRADLKFFKGLTGHVVYEYNMPGDYYAFDDAGHFFRIELNYAFSHGFDL